MVELRYGFGLCYGWFELFGFVFLVMAEVSLVEVMVAAVNLGILFG
jgi:hypothetical protein